MSVFWEEGRKDLEAFAHAAAGPPDGKPSPRNYFIKPSPDQMLRVMVGLGLKRGKLEAVYAALRGRVPTTGVIDPARREAGFKRLKGACDAALNVKSLAPFSEWSAIGWVSFKSDDQLGAGASLCLHNLFGGH